MGSTTDEKPWAVLVYMVADHKSGNRVLDQAADRELLAILEAARETDMPVVVQVDYRVRRGVTRLTANATRGGIRWEPVDTEQHRVKRQVLQSDATLDLQVERGAESDAAGPDVLKGFLRWARTRVRAKRYAMLFWGHSCGPGGLFYDNRGGRDPHPLSLDGIEQAMQGTPADVVLFRDCCMSTLETAFQLRDVARYAIASQSIVPIKGQWPYVDLFAILQTASAGNEPMVARALAARLGTYHDDPRNRGRFADVPYTLLDLQGVPAVQVALSAFVTACDLARTDARLLTLASQALERARPVRAGDPALVDIRRMCGGLSDAPASLGVAARSVAEAIEGQLVKWNRAQNRSFGGISAYYKPSKRRAEGSFIDPWMTSDMYGRLALSRATGWNRLALQPLRVEAAVRI